jgi:hypothetical protein
MLGTIQEQIKTNWKTLENESGDFFEINCKIFNETVAAFFVTGWLNERVKNAGNLSKVDGGALDQGEDESGEEVDSTLVPMKVGFQGLLEFCMLFRRASKFLFAGGPNCFIWRAGRLSQTYVRYYGIELWNCNTFVVVRRFSCKPHQAAVR